MPNAYLDIQTLKSEGGLNLTTGTLYDTRLRQLAEHVSQQLNRWCNRYFYYTIGTKTFSGNGKAELLVPDLISIDSLKEDNNMDGTFDTTWNANDYVLYPFNSAPTSTDGLARPYSSILVNDKSNGTQDVFLRHQNNYQIVGTWGFQKIAVDSGLNGSLANSTAVSMIMSAAVTGTIEPGHTCLIGDEVVYVTATNGTAATVTRAVNGSTATTHATKDVSIIQYPYPLQEAVMIQVSHLFRRRDSDFAVRFKSIDTGLSGFHDMLDGDVKVLLYPYRRVGVGLL